MIRIGLLSAGLMVGCSRDTTSGLIETSVGGGVATGGGESLGGGGVDQGTGGLVTEAGSGGSGPLVTGGQSSAGSGGELLSPGQAMECGSVAVVAATVRLEAECAHGIGCPAGVTGTQQGTELENGSTTVGYVEGGDWLKFDPVALDGLTTFTVRYAKETTGGSIELRLDSPDGLLLGSFTPSPTGGWATWREASGSLTTAVGVHSVYVVAAGSTEGIANLDWVELSAGSESGGGALTFRLNHLGFSTMGPKHVVVEGGPGLDRFDVVDAATGSSRWCGAVSGETFSTWGSSSTFYSVDFTGLTVPGTYRLQLGGTASDPFVIADRRLASETLAAVVGYFRGARADDAQIWSADASIPFVDGGEPRDVRGGWYDASGDVSKYLTHLSYANFLNPQQIPLVAWALAWTRDEGGEDFLGSQAEALQAEALWGADYLVRVLDPAGFFYTNVFDQWTGFTSDRQICAFEGSTGERTNEYQSALREGGGMSIAALARVARWGAAGEFTSDRYLAAAQAAFAHLDVHGVQYADDGRENVIDDYAGLLAASELAESTGDLAYVEAARRRATSLVGRLSATGYFVADGGTRPFWHASDAGLPVVALARYLEVETDAASREAARAAIATHLAYQLEVTRAVSNPFGYARQHTGATASFFIPQANETGYWWQGENARLASLAAAALLGSEAVGATGDDALALMRFAGHQVDWILGNNPRDICFMHGYGRNNPPPYSGVKPEVGTLVGGIANGLTGTASGIQWMAGVEDWEQWRWVEQWLPHAAWYLVAITAMER